MIQARFCVLARLFIWKFATFLDITRLWLTTIELTELNTMIVGVLFTFYSLSTVEVDNKPTKNVKDAMFYASYQSWNSRPLLELTTIAFRANRNLEEAVFFINWVTNWSLQSYLKPGTCYTAVNYWSWQP